MRLFRTTGVTLECDECRARFEDTQGGQCPRCERLLCDRHLYGSWLRRLRSHFGLRTTCVECLSRGSEAPQ